MRPKADSMATGARRAGLGFTMVALAAVAFSAASARAEDQLKVAIGQINNWENQAPTLGQDAGIFKRHNLVLENVGTHDAGDAHTGAEIGAAGDDGLHGLARALRADILEHEVMPLEDAGVLAERRRLVLPI